MSSVLLLKHTSTQLLQGVSCKQIPGTLSGSKLQFSKCLIRVPAGPSLLLELLIEDLCCKLCQGAEAYQVFILFTASFHQCKFPMDTIYLHLKLLNQINNMVWNRSSICAFTCAQHPEVWYMIR